MFIKYVPNLLSLFRIFCSFPFVYFLAKDFKLCAFIILLFGCLSDFFDGYIARKFNLTSSIGELLDPLADKVFSNCVLWSFVILGKTSIPLIHFCLATALSFRDISLVIGATYVVATKKSIILKPMVVSKLCTSTIFLYICYITIFNQDSISKFFGYISIALICISFLLYCVRYIMNVKKMFDWFQKYVLMYYCDNTLRSLKCMMTII